MASKYLVYAGCANEGNVLQGQPYDGPIDSESVADFAETILAGSIYSMSNTTWGLQTLDWTDVEDASGDEDEPIYIVADYDGECFDGCGPDACECTPEEYFVSVVLNKDGK